MLDKLYPNRCELSVFDINYESLYSEGYKGIIFDIDNTLVEPNCPINDKVKDLFNKLFKIGFKICLISNNCKSRVEDFLKEYKKNHISYIYDAQKPNRKSYLKCAYKMGLDKSQIISVGDQIFTDTLGANIAGIYSILIKPIYEDKNVKNKLQEVNFKVKRFLEKGILYLYNKKFY